MSKPVIEVTKYIDGRFQDAAISPIDFPHWRSRGYIFKDSKKNKQIVKAMVYDAYALLSGGFVEGHLQGVKLLEIARMVCPSLVDAVDTEIDKEIEGRDRDV